MSVVVLSCWRTKGLRAAYVRLAIGLALNQLPLLSRIGSGTKVMGGVATCMLSTLCVLSFVGLLRSVSMLPPLLFEIACKGLWPGLVDLPAWTAGPLHEAMAANLFEVALVVPIALLVSWELLPRLIAGGSDVV